MTLSIDEFIRRFLVHVLPKGFHRIRHYGLLANSTRKANIARAREMLGAPMPDRSARAACRLLGSTLRVPLLRRAHDRDRELRGRRPRPGSAPAPMEIRMMAS